MTAALPTTGASRWKFRNGRRRRPVLRVSKLDVAGEGREARRPARLRRGLREERGEERVVLRFEVVQGRAGDGDARRESR